MKKRVISMVLAAAMALSVSALADEPATTYPETPPNIKETTGGKSNTTTELVGTIQPTTLAVTIPTKVTFDVDPTIDVEDATLMTGKNPVTAQVKQPEIKITNNSVVPVYTKIESVTVNGATLVQYDANSNNTPNLKTANAVMFGYKFKDTIQDFATATDWLTSGTQSGVYALGADDGKIAARSVDADTGNTTATEQEMEICLQTINGWSAGDTFTVTPTIVVSVTKFSA